MTQGCEPRPQKMASGPAPDTLLGTTTHACTVTQAQLCARSSLKHTAWHTCALIPTFSPTYVRLLTCAPSFTCATKSTCSPAPMCSPLSTAVESQLFP